MAEVASAYVTLLPSARGFGSATQRQIGPQMGPAGAAIGAGLGRSMLKGFIAIGVITKITGFVSDAFSEAREAQKVGSLTDAAIKSTGGVAKVSANQIERLADSLSRKTGIDDEAIQSSENLLLTFKNVRREGAGVDNIFARATRSAADLSKAGFGDLSGTSKQLGKALNDPVKGMTALGRAGVTFTQKQQDRIKHLVEEGHTLKAQKAILREVESQTGGAAAATATWGDKSKVAFDNIKESVGTALLPAVDGIEKGFVTKVAPAITGFISNLTSGKGKAGEFGNFLRDKVAPAIRDALGDALDRGKQAFDSIRKAIQDNKPELTQLFNAFKKVAGFMLTKLAPAMIRIQAGLLPLLGKAIGVVINFAVFWVRRFNDVKNVVQKVGDFVSGAVRFFKRFVEGAKEQGRTLIDWFQALPGRIKEIVKRIPGMLKSLGGQIVDGLVKGITEAAHKVTDAVKALVDKIPGFIKDRMGISSPSKVTTELGRNISEGLARGIADGGKKVSDATQKVIDDLKSKLSTLKSDFASLKDSVAGAFTGNLFEATNGGDFLASLTSTKGTLTQLKSAFTTLLGWGLKPQFLSQLFASGNAGLILDLAANKAAATQGAALFNDVQSLSASLGGAVAREDPVGKRLDKTNDKLDKILAELKTHPERNGREMNRPAGNARRRARAA